MAVYSQRDPAWSGDTLGFGPDSIGMYGCFVTEWAQLMTWAGHPMTPAQMDQALRDKGLFVDCGGVECLTDTALHDAFPDLWGVPDVRHCESFACPQDWLENDGDDYTVCWLSAPQVGFTSHFVGVVDWHAPTFADPWFGEVTDLSFYGGWSKAIQKVIRIRYLGNGQPAPSPTPSPAPAVPVGPVTFQGVTCPAGVHVRVLPGTDQAIVPQPGANPDVVDGGTTLTFDAWCHHTPNPANGADTMPTDYWTNQQDDRWFRVAGTGHWIASGGIKGNPPDGMAPLADPNPAPLTPPSVPVTPAQPAVPVVPFRGNPKALGGAWCWEWEDEAPYAQLKALGFTGVLIRAANGGPGSNDDRFWQQFQARQLRALAAGLEVVPWDYWYGPGDAGYTETDPAAYLRTSAEHLAGRGINAPAYVVDYESRDQTGLAGALKHLRDVSGGAVLLCPPGDPVEFGVSGWSWPDIDAAVDGLVPQLYTSAWPASLTLEKAWGEFQPNVPLWPACDEQDPIRVAAWVTGVRKRDAAGYSYWRAGVGTAATLQAYVPGAPAPDPVPSPAPAPVPSPAPRPTPAPPAPCWPAPQPESWWVILLDWLRGRRR